MGAIVHVVKDGKFNSSVSFLWNGCVEDSELLITIIMYICIYVYIRCLFVNIAKMKKLYCIQS